MRWTTSSKFWIGKAKHHILVPVFVWSLSWFLFLGPVGTRAWTMHRRPSRASFRHHQGIPRKWFVYQKSRDLNKGWQSNRHLLCYRCIWSPCRSQDHWVNPSTDWRNHPESETESNILFKTSARNCNWFPLWELIQSSFISKFQIGPVLLMITSIQKQGKMCTNEKKRKRFNVYRGKYK